MRTIAGLVQVFESGDATAARLAVNGWGGCCRCAGRKALVALRAAELVVGLTE